jgi:hypothetical protein
LVAAILDDDVPVRLDALRTLLDLAEAGLARYGVDAVNLREDAAAAITDRNPEVCAVARALLAALDGAQAEPAQ